MHHLVSARLALVALLAAAVALSAPPASANDLATPSEAALWRSVGRIHIRTNLPDTDLPVQDDRSPPVVFVLPDDIWDTRRAWTYIDQLSLHGMAVVELFPDQDQHLSLDEARAAIASATDELGLEPSRVALLGFGTGGRLALALAGPDRPAAALYPVCQGLPAPQPGARVLVLHPDEASEAQRCAALTIGRPEARSSRASAGAGHGWDVVGERIDGRTLLPHPDAPHTLVRRLHADPDAWATFHAARTVSKFFLGGLSARLPAKKGT